MKGWVILSSISSRSSPSSISITAAPPLQRTISSGCISSRLQQCRVSVLSNGTISGGRSSLLSNGDLRRVAMLKGSKGKCESPSHKLLKEKTKTRLEDLQGMLTNVQAAKKRVELMTL
ncbi:vascular plant one zinc finger protein [Prunus dulcis]|uniref:Vascular plant one zinc finger protein n=1 Tax=Prunus dulcis TaxID=3755 RepID=A0A5H2XF06_PRUDU|nr:vascular plant one zinc finger protein [Prunus dulcis]